MKATGIVRRIDELGRIVIPKEIRKGLRLREGDSLEIFIEQNDSLVLKKYAPIESIQSLAESYASELSRISNFPVVITDNSSIITASGISKNEFVGKNISSNLLSIMDYRTVWTTSEERAISIFEGDKKNRYYSQIVMPIIVDGDAVGTVIMFSIEPRQTFTQTEIKLVISTAAFIGKNLE